ncbi:hypothetical protein [Phyllobacterium endophyticum]|uniref:hypothetical protein n=1 Tax=Phyllobacterium endophyticum TaxID=1149773 RepID=UPI0011B2969D|nr:hypothetical protein [Phyllobacterium endophyticum]MBB3233558.1 hypothetical protein [Phyllobacterium endophyticum]TYR41221.1 hypothetical protein FY050_07855 [Phyllobacterium endophyticum]
MKPHLKKYTPALLLVVLAFAGTLSACARVYYGSFRYDATCVDHDPRYPEDGPVCVVRKTR